MPRQPAEPAPAKETPPSAEPLTPTQPSLGPPSSILENEAQTGDVNCQRVYNDRNCCDEDRKCSTARQALRDNSITKISLDITAPFKPDAATVGEEREAREGQLRQMPARDWKNRAGQVVASGRLQDIHNRKIQVAGADGQVAELRLGELSDDDLCFLAAWWGVPTECTLGDDQFVPRAWDQVTFTWKASALCHKPLYFEEVGLERYGHTMGPLLEPVHSGAHFFLNVAFLPYKMGINPPHECQYALGYYRPGNCAPWLVPPVPISLRGACSRVQRRWVWFISSLEIPLFLRVWERLGRQTAERLAALRRFAFLNVAVVKGVGSRFRSSALPRGGSLAENDSRPRRLSTVDASLRDAFFRSRSDRSPFCDPRPAACASRLLERTPSRAALGPAAGGHRRYPADRQGA